MSEIVKMPALGESVTEGTVVRWLKEVGRSEERGVGKEGRSRWSPYPEKQ